jgi:hypothetical protein
MKKHIVPCLLILSLLFCLVVPTVFAADAWDTKDVAYEDIDDLVDACVDFPDIVSQLEASSTALTTYAATLKTKLDTLDPNSPDYQSTNSELALATASIAQVNVSVNVLQNQMGGKNDAHDATVIAAKTLFITYNTLRDQINEQSRKLTVFNTNLNNLEQQNKAGYLSDLQWEKTKTQGSSLQLSIQTMQSQLDVIKRSFNTLLGRDYNHTLGIHSLPFSELNDITTIKFSDDLDDALANYSGDTTGTNYNNPDYDEDKGTFAASFRKLYDSITDKGSLLTNEQSILAVEQKSFTSSKIQFDAGYLSQIALTSAQDDLDTETAKVKSAQTALFSAYEQYRWAMEYGVISGS